MGEMCVNTFGGAYRTIIAAKWRLLDFLGEEGGEAKTQIGK